MEACKMVRRPKENMKQFQLSLQLSLTHQGSRHRGSYLKITSYLESFVDARCFPSKSKAKT